MIHLLWPKVVRTILETMVLMGFILKISSDQIWVAGYFGQPLTYPNFIIFSFDFLYNSLKS